MSWSIPAQIEQDFISGRAQYRTFQTGMGGQSILPVPSNAYAVIFGYDFSPAGGGFRLQATQSANAQITANNIRWFETQQISFYTGTDFYPFIHHVDINIVPFAPGVSQFDTYNVNNTPITRQVYITSDKDITITVGLVQQAQRNIFAAIPVTNRTPGFLTYGGSGQLINIQTNFGPGATPNEFVQPSLKDFAAFNIPGVFPRAVDQAFAPPDLLNGLLDPTVHLANLGANFVDAAACNYFLCLHYALYTSAIPEQRG